MAIDFPTSPVTGSTYTYNETTFTYHAGGYWHVAQAGSMSVATGAEVLTGTDNAKVTTPKALADAGVTNDSEDETIAGSWTFDKTPIGFMAGGDVKSDGTTQDLSNGWTVANNGTGKYILTTSLSGAWVVTTSVWVNGLSSADRVCGHVPTNSNSFDVTTVEFGVLTDLRWFFTAVKVSN